MYYTASENGHPLTSKEELLLSQSLQTAIRLLTKAGALSWAETTRDSLSDCGRFIRGEIKDDGITKIPVLTCTLTIETGILEDFTGDSRQIIEVGPKIWVESEQYKSYLSMDIGPEVLEEIVASVECEA